MGWGQFAHVIALTCSLATSASALAQSAPQQASQLVRGAVRCPRGRIATSHQVMLEVQPIDVPTAFVVTTPLNLESSAPQDLITLGVEQGLSPDFVDVISQTARSSQTIIAAVGYSGIGRGYLLRYRIADSTATLLDVISVDVDLGSREFARDDGRAHPSRIAGGGIRIYGAQHRGTGDLTTDVAIDVRVINDRMRITHVAGCPQSGI